MASPVRATPMANTTFQADQDEPESPKMVTADPEGAPDEELKLKKGQEEDSEGDSKEREEDIYADEVLACSIENKDACVMCSG